MKATDEQILDAYARHGSVNKAGDELGMRGSSVHERLVKLGANATINVFTDAEIERLRADYVIYRDGGALQMLADEMGRTKAFICRQAGKLGLTDLGAPKLGIRTWKGMPESTALVIWEDFKSSTFGLGVYCKRKGYDDLGFATTMRKHFGDEWDHVIELKTPKTSRYRAGRAFEYRCRDHLRDAGYFVLRSPASRSPVDLVAITTGTVLFVQCKKGSSIGVAEWNTLYDLAESTGAIPILVEMAGGPRSTTWWRMTARKDGSRSRQPRERFDPAAHTVIEVERTRVPALRADSR